MLMVFALGICARSAMSLDERDYMRERKSYSLPEEEKERRMQEMRRRLDAATGDDGGPPDSGNRYFSAAPFVLLAIVCAYAASYFFSNKVGEAVSNRPVVNVFNQRQQIAPQVGESQNVPLKREGGGHQATAEQVTVPPVPTAAPSVINSRSTKPENARESYQQKVTSAPEECRREKSALKELECINRVENRQKQLARQPAQRVNGDWMEKYEKQRHPLIP